MGPRPPRSKSLADYLEKKGLPVKNNRLMIATGSLQATHILAKAFTDQETRCWWGTPGYQGALGLRACQAELVSVPLRAISMDVAKLEERLESAANPEIPLLHAQLPQRRHHLLAQGKAE